MILIVQKDCLSAGVQEKTKPGFAGFRRKSPKKKRRFGKMKFESFTEELKEAVEKALSGKAEVKILTVEKLNAGAYTGIAMKGDKEMSPVCSVEELYGKYKNGMSMEAISDMLLSIFDKSSEIQMDLGLFRQWDAMKGRLRMKLVNYEANSERLVAVPHVRFYDMAIVFYLRLARDEQEAAVLNVDNGFMADWNVTGEELYRTAYANMAQSVSFYVGAYRKDALFILSEEKENGAAALLFRDSLEKIREKMGGGYYALPVTGFEIVAVSDRETCPDKVRALFCELCQSIQEEAPVLSNEIFHYDRENGLRVMEG